MKKTAVITHSIDLDGWMSGAIVQLWFEKTYPTNRGITNCQNVKVNPEMLPEDYQQGYLP